jgi:hypothetical protein
VAASNTCSLYLSPRQRFALAGAAQNIREGNILDALTFLRQDHKSVLGTLEVLEDAWSGSGAQFTGLDTMVKRIHQTRPRAHRVQAGCRVPAVRSCGGQRGVGQARRESRAR